jgi:hypothetical protein
MRPMRNLSGGLSGPRVSRQPSLPPPSPKRMPQQPRRNGARSPSTAPQAAETSRIYGRGRRPICWPIWTSRPHPCQTAFDQPWDVGLAVMGWNPMHKRGEELVRRSAVSVLRHDSWGCSRRFSVFASASPFVVLLCSPYAKRCGSNLDRRNLFTRSSPRSRALHRERPTATGRQESTHV